MRKNALPTLKNKEAALRSSVQTAKAEARRLAEELERAISEYDYLSALWNEFERIVDFSEFRSVDSCYFDGLKLYVCNGNQSWLKLVPQSGKIVVFREDHSQVMNAGVRLYADAQNAKTKMENGFDLSDYDLRCLDYAKEYATRLLSIDVNIGIEEMLDTAWEIFAKYFSPAETGIKQVFIDKYWKK